MRPRLEYLPPYIQKQSTTLVYVVVNDIITDKDTLIDKCAEYGILDFEIRYVTPKFITIKLSNEDYTKIRLAWHEVT